MEQQQRQSYDGSWYDKDYFDNPLSGKGYPMRYAPDSAPWAALARWIIHKVKPQTVADLGAAKGYLLYEFVKRGIFGIGWDFSPYAVEHCLKQVIVYQHDIRKPVEWSLNRPPDVAFLLDVLEHQTETDLDAIMITLALLRPRLIVVHAGLAGTEDENEASHVTLWTRAEWLAYFHDNALQAVDWQDEYRAHLNDLGAVGQTWAERAFVLERQPTVYRDMPVSQWMQDENLKGGVTVLEPVHG